MPIKSLRRWAHKPVPLFLVIRRRITEATMLKASLYTSILWTTEPLTVGDTTRRPRHTDSRAHGSQINMNLTPPTVHTTIRPTSLTHHCYLSCVCGGEGGRRGGRGGWKEGEKEERNLPMERWKICSRVSPKPSHDIPPIQFPTISAYHQDYYSLIFKRHCIHENQISHSR